jgi:hypothetical protein
MAGLDPATQSSRTNASTATLGGRVALRLPGHDADRISIGVGYFPNTPGQFLSAFAMCPGMSFDHVA